MEKQTIVIAGGMGMMGSAATQYLHSKYPHLEIYVLDDLSGSYKESYIPGTTFINIDLRDSHKVKLFFNEYFKDKKLDFLMHYASAAHEIRSFFTPIENMSRNIDAFRNTLTYALEKKVKHISFFSSMSRYGHGILTDGNNDVVQNSKPPFSENMIPAPQDPYATAKVASELMLKSFQNVFDFTYTIWVPHNCFGPNQYVDPYRNVLAIWMNLLLINKSPVIYGSGEQTRAISWVDDFNPIVCDSLFNKATYNETINIGGDEHKTVNEWYELVKKVSGKNIDAIHMEKRPGEVPNAYCNHDKAFKLTGFKNSTNIENALTQMWNFFKKKGHRPFPYLEEFEINSEKIPTTWKNKLF